jgi:hypothetical protein
MTKRCANCKHLYDENESHECPSRAYLATKERLMSEALDAEVPEEDENPWDLCLTVENVESTVRQLFPNGLPTTNPFASGPFHDAYESMVGEQSERLYRQENP